MLCCIMNELHGSNAVVVTREIHTMQHLWHLHLRMILPRLPDVEVVCEVVDVLVLVVVTRDDAKI